MTSPSPPPPPEGLPEEIVKAIEAFDQALRYHDGPVQEARSALDTTILHHLSAARARAERAEKALAESEQLRQQDRAWYEMTVSVVEEQRDTYRARASLSPTQEP